MFPTTVTVHTPAQLYAVLMALQPQLAAKADAKTTDAKPEKEVKPDPKPQAQATDAPAPATPAPTPPTAAAPAADAQEAKPAVKYDQVKKVVNELYAIDPQHAIAALAKFGVKNGKELPEAKWADFVAHGQAQLTALKVAA